MKLTLTLTAETDADQARIAQLTAEFGGAPAAETVAEAPKGKGKGKKDAKPAADAPKKDAEPELNHKTVRKMFGDMVAALGDDKGSKEGKALLKKYNAKQVPDIAKDDLPKVAAELEKLIASAKDAGSEEDDDTDFLGGDDDSEGDDE